MHAVVALLYPFSWQHTFIPVLPGSMLDIVCCPTPFLVGLLSSSLPKLKELPVEEVSAVSFYFDHLFFALSLNSKFWEIWIFLSWLMNFMMRFSLTSFSLSLFEGTSQPTSKKCSNLQVKAHFYRSAHTRETTQPSHVRDIMCPRVSDRSVGRDTSCHLLLYLLTWLLETVPAALGQGAGYILDASY